MHKVAIVEDDPIQRLMLNKLLASDYEILPFASGESFLEAQPEIDALLLDIELPGIKGYDICRQVRSLDQYRHTPVIFVSAHDTAPERIAAYEAGGDDFLIKPVVASELRHKVEGAVSQHDALASLQSQSSMAQQMAFSAMSGMGDLGVIIDFQRKAALCRSYEELAAATVTVLSAWDLRGIVQIRGLAGDIMQGTDAVISPLQASVMATMREMGRIFELKSRAVVNYDHVSVLVNNLPVDNPEKLGRLRDNLAMVVEGADICVASMDTGSARLKQIRDLGSAIEELRNLMQKAAVRDADNRNAIHRLTIDTIDALARSVDGFGLTTVQNEYVSSLAHEALDELNATFEEASHIQQDFTEIFIRLQELAGNPHG